MSAGARTVFHPPIPLNPSSLPPSYPSQPFLTSSSPQPHAAVYSPPVRCARTRRNFKGRTPLPEGGTMEEFPCTRPPAAGYADQRRRGARPHTRAHARTHTHQYAAGMRSSCRRAVPPAVSRYEEKKRKHKGYVPSKNNSMCRQKTTQCVSSEDKGMCMV